MDTQSGTGVGVTEGIRRRLPPIRVTPSLRKRFDSKVNRGGPDDCWLWMASVRNGYGAIKIGGRVYSCHRVAYVLANGEPPDGMVVGHKCDTPACCNPDHLEAISVGKNNCDARSRRKFLQPRGEECWNAVLNEDLVRKIRAAYVPGVFSCRRIARSLGCSESLVKNVLFRGSWSHVE